MSPGGRLDFCYWRSKGEGLRIYIYIYIYIYIIGGWASGKYVSNKLNYCHVFDIFFWGGGGLKLYWEDEVGAVRADYWGGGI